MIYSGSRSVSNSNRAGSYPKLGQVKRKPNMDFTRQYQEVGYVINAGNYHFKIKIGPTGQIFYVKKGQVYYWIQIRNNHSKYLQGLGPTSPKGTVLAMTGPGSTTYYGCFADPELSTIQYQHLFRTSHGESTTLPAWQSGRERLCKYRNIPPNQPLHRWSFDKPILSVTFSELKSMILNKLQLLQSIARRFELPASRQIASHLIIEVYR